MPEWQCPVIDLVDLADSAAMRKWPHCARLAIQNDSVFDFNSPKDFFNFLEHSQIQHEAAVIYKGSDPTGAMSKLWSYPLSGKDATQYSRYFEDTAHSYSSILFGEDGTERIMQRFRHCNKAFEVIDGFCGKGKDLRIQAFISADESHSLTHRDTTASMLYVTSGSKSVWIAPPTATKMYQQSARDPNFLTVNPHKAMKDSNEWQHFKLNAGDAIQIPRGWWHNIKSTKGTLGFGFKCKHRLLLPYYVILFAALPFLYLVRSAKMRAALLLTLPVILYLR